MTLNSELMERAGIVYEIRSPSELIMDCSCHLCGEYGTVHFKQPHGLELKSGDWIRVWFREIYNYELLPFDTDIWEVDAERLERTSRLEEICRLEKCGETQYGWYETLLFDEYPEIVVSEEEGEDLLEALKAHRESLIAKEKGEVPPEQMRLPF